MIHVLVAEEGALEPLRHATAQRKTVRWIVPKSADTGDKVLFFYRSLGFLGHGEIVSKPKPAMHGKRQTYSTGVGEVVLFESAVPLETVGKQFSMWAWVRYPRSFTKPETPLAEQVFEFVSAQAKKKHK